MHALPGAATPTTRNALDGARLCMANMGVIEGPNEAFTARLSRSRARSG